MEKKTLDRVATEGFGVNVWFVNKDGSEGMFDNSIDDEIKELAKKGELDADSLMKFIEVRYEGDSDLKDCDYISRIEITNVDAEILCAFDYEP